MPKNVVFCLTRGYPSEEMYTKLINRNKAIAQYLKDEDMDLVFFHEGNVPEHHQKYIETQTPELHFKWVQVPWDFPNIQMPAAVIQTFYNGLCYPGYHIMCQFHSTEVWQYLREYDIALRVDEDCVLTSPKWSEVFKSLDDGHDYKTPMYDVEIHDWTNMVLPEWLGEDSCFYDRTLPYTNVFVTRVAPWFRDDVQEWLRKLRESQNCLRFRWGDHAIHSVVLRKFKIPNTTLDGYSYFHGSHGRQVQGTKDDEQFTRL